MDKPTTALKKHCLNFKKNVLMEEDYGLSQIVSVLYLSGDFQRQDTKQVFTFCIRECGLVMSLGALFFSRLVKEVVIRFLKH